MKNLIRLIVVFCVGVHFGQSLWWKSIKKAVLRTAERYAEEWMKSRPSDAK